MFDKIKKRLNYTDLKGLLDVRNIGMIIFGIIILLVSWSGVKVIQSNYELQKQISIAQQKNDLQSLENNNLKLKNQYLGTDQYLELSAREHFNKAAPGEKLLIVPHSVALSHSTDIPAPQQASTPTAVPQAWYEHNFNAWLDFFFRRSSQG